MASPQRVAFLSPCHSWTPGGIPRRGEQYSLLGQQGERPHNGIVSYSTARACTDRCAAPEDLAALLCDVFHPFSDATSVPHRPSEGGFPPCQEGPRPIGQGPSRVHLPEGRRPSSGKARQEVLDVEDWKVRASSSARSRAQP